MANDLDDNWQLPDAPASASSAPKPGELDDNWKLPDTNPKYGSFWDNVKGDAKFAGRQIALGARGAVQGVEGLPMMALDTGVDITNMAKKGLNMLGLDKDPTYMQRPSVTNDQDLTAAGVPAPQNTGEQLVAGTAGMLAGARLPTGQMPQAPGQMLGPASKAVTDGQTAGQVTGNENVQAVESTLARAPGGGAIRKAITTQKNNLVGGIQDIVDNLAGSKGTTPYSVGTALDTGIKQGAKDLKDAGGAVFDLVDSKVPTDLQTKLPGTQKLLDAFTRIDPNAPATSALLKDPAVGAIQHAFQKDMTVPGVVAKASTILGSDGAPAFTTPGIAASTKDSLPYQTIKGLITDLSQSIDWSPLNGDAVNGAKKALYLAMRKDLNASAESVSPELAAQVKGANKNWEDISERLGALTKAVGGNGGPEQIFNRLVSGAKSGPSGLSQVMDVLSDSNQKLLAAGFLQKLGRAPGAAQTAAGDAFDADTFFSNWGKLDPEAKQRLFGSLPQEYMKNMNQLVENARTLKAYQSVLPNASNTARASVWGASMGVALTSLLHGDLKSAGIAAVGAPAATAVMSRVLTNPRIVQRLARESAPSKVLGLSGAAVGADYGTPEKQGSAVGR